MRYTTARVRSINASKATLEWVDSDDDVRFTSRYHTEFPDKPAKDATYTIGVAREEFEYESLIEIHAEDKPTLFALFDEPLATGDEMTTTTSLPIICKAEILSAGPTVDKQLLAITLPGGERPVTRRYSKDYLIAGTVPKPGDKVFVRVTLTPAERIIIEEIASEHEKLTKVLAAVAEVKAAPAPIGRVSGPDAADLPRGVYYPQADPLYAMPPELQDYVEAKMRVHRDGERVHVIVTGPPGTGKTSLIAAIAARWGHPYCKIDMGSVTDPEVLLGHRALDGTKTVNVEGLLVRAARTPNCIIHLDEVNRTATNNTNALLPIMDHTGQVWSEYLQDYIRVDPTVMIFGTANMELNDSGTFQMNPALRSRFEYPIEVGYPSVDAEAQILVRRCRIDERTARALVEFANEIRKLADPANADPLGESIGTRNLISVGHLVRTGLEPGEAIKHCVLPRYSTEGGDGGQRGVVVKVLQGRFGGR